VTRTGAMKTASRDGPIADVPRRKEAPMSLTLPSATASEQPEAFCADMRDGFRSRR